MLLYLQEGFFPTALASSSPSLTSPHRGNHDIRPTATAALPTMPQGRLAMPRGSAADRSKAFHPRLFKTQPAAAAAQPAAGVGARRPCRAAAAAATATLRSLTSSRWALGLGEGDEDEEWQHTSEAWGAAEGAEQEEDASLDYEVEEGGSGLQPRRPPRAPAEQAQLGPKKKHNPW